MQQMFGHPTPVNSDNTLLGLHPDSLILRLRS
jgi:hypothetical protein